MGWVLHIQLCTLTHVLSLIRKQGAQNCARSPPAPVFFPGSLKRYCTDPNTPTFPICLRATQDGVPEAGFLHSRQRINFRPVLTFHPQNKMFPLKCLNSISFLLLFTLTGRSFCYCCCCCFSAIFPQAFFFLHWFQPISEATIKHWQGRSGHAYPLTQTNFYPCLRFPIKVVNRQVLSGVFVPLGLIPYKCIFLS